MNLLLILLVQLQYYLQDHYRCQLVNQFTGLLFFQKNQNIVNMYIIEL